MSKSPSKNATTIEGMFKSLIKDWVPPALAADIYFSGMIELFESN